MAGERSKAFHYSRTTTSGPKFEEVAKQLFTAETWNWIPEPISHLPPIDISDGMPRSIPGGPRGHLRLRD